MHAARRRVTFGALPRELSQWLSGRRYAAWAIAVLGLTLASPALWTEPVADDLLHELLLRKDPGIDGLEPRALDLFRFATGDADRTRALMNEGVFPWWTDPDVRLAFFRPLTGLTHWLDWRWFGGSTWLTHLHSLGWYAALLALLAVTYRRFAARATALLALFLYAVDDAHAPTVGWVANRSALLAICFSMLALNAHDAWRKSGRPSLAWRGPAWLGLALLSGETGVAGVAYLLAYALFLERGSLRARAITLAGPALVLLVWRIAYVRLGYGTSGSGVYFDPGSSPLAFAAALAERAPVLSLATVLGPWADYWEVYALISAWAAPAVWCFALVVLVAVGLGLRAVLRESATARFWAAGSILSVIPAASTFPHDRMLLGVTVGFMALLAELLTSLRPSKSRGYQLVVSTLVFVHLLLAPVLKPIRAANVDQLSRWLARSIANFPSPGELAQRTVVLLNPPADPFAAYLPLYFETQRWVRPRHFLWLASGVSKVRITRVDERTLAVRPERGYLAHATELMLRSRSRPISLGQTVQLDAATFRVTALSTDGRPAEVSVRFARPLEDPALLFMKWHGDRYVRFTPPAENQVVELSAVDFAQLLSN